MIGAELEAQRSSPAEFARGIQLAMMGAFDDPRAIAALRNGAEILIRHAQYVTEGKWR